MEKELENKIIHALAGTPVDFKAQMAFLGEKKQKGAKWDKAGVLVLLGKDPVCSDSASQYFFLLNKRSLHVQQPGDLCFPGGHPNQWFDLLLSRLILPHFLPLRKGPGFRLNKEMQKDSFKTILYFFSTALREGFEEMRLNPFGVDFLGALRCYRLQQFQRVIFPIVAIMKKEMSLKLNWEVEKIVKIPLAALFDHRNYARYKLKVKGKFKRIFKSDWVEYDCFIHREDGQLEEVLWGATYKITMAFLKTVFSFEPPHEKIRPVIEGELYPAISGE